MNDALLTDRMQAVLDGTASEGDTAQLHALLARDPDAAREFAAWTALFDGLSSLPMVHPPEGLVAAIDAALPRTVERRVPAEKIFADSFQLFPDESVIGSGITQSTRRPFGFKSISSWLTPASSRESHHMNTQQKVLAGGAAAIVALGLAAVLSGYPPKSTDVVGTVVPAERYRAPQAGAEAVKLGEQSTIATTGTSIDAGGPAAANIEADRNAFMASADKMSKLSEADRQAFLSQMDKVSKLSEADRQAFLSQAEKAGQLNAADRIAVQAQADRMSKLSEADRAAYLSQLDKVSRLSVADRQAFLSQADRIAVQSQADRMGKLSEADRIAVQAQADKMSKLSEADRAAYLSQLDKVSKLSEADRQAFLSQAEKAGQLNAADRIAVQSQADKMSKLSEADRAAYLSQLDKVSRLSQADRAAYLSQADRSMAQSQADRAANRVDQADKASVNLKN